MSQVKVGPTTVAGGTITLAAYAVAVVAFIQGARDEQTISALVVGTVSLVTTLGGRYAQAVAQVKAVAPDVAAALKTQTDLATAVQSTSNFQLTKSLADLVSGQIVGRGLKGSTFTEPRPGVSVTNTPLGPDDSDPEPPGAPRDSIADPLLDDPGLPTPEQHSGLED
jgi:hypothetical protein